MLAVLSFCDHLKHFLVSLKLFSDLLWRFQLDYISTFHLSQILLPDTLQIYTLFTNWYCIHICISYTFLTIFCPVCMILLAHMFSELTFSHGNKEFVCFFVGKTISPAPSIPQLVYSSSYNVKAWWLFPIPFFLFVAFILVHLTFGHSCWWDFMCVASDFTRRHNLITNYPILWLLTSFLPCSMPGTGNLANYSVLLKLLLFLTGQKMF